MTTDVSSFSQQLAAGRIDDPGSLVSALWAMRREDRHAEAFGLAERSVQLLPDEPALRDVGAMLFYDLKIKPLADDAEIPVCARLFRESDRFRAVPMADGSVHGRIYSYRLVALRLAKVAVERDPSLAIRILETVVVRALPSERRAVDQPGGRRDEMPSDLDNYYLRLTKAFELASRWRDLLAVEVPAVAALAGSPHQHWIVLRLAKAAIETGDVARAEALSSHRSVDRRNPQWVPVIARIQAGRGDDAGAIESLKALIGRAPNLPYQVNNIATLAGLLEGRDRRISDSLTMLEFHIRRRQNWGIRPNLQARVDEVVTPVSELWDEARLRSWMSETSASSRNRHTGVVKRHLENGSAGFIARDDGGDIFFALPRGGNKPLPAVGTKVSFVIEPSFDKKRNRPSERASDVKEVAG